MGDDLVRERAIEAAAQKMYAVGCERLGRPDTPEQRESLLPVYREEAIQVIDASGLLDALTAAEAERDEAVELLRSLYNDFSRMPDAMLTDADPRRAWWFDTFPSRKAVGDFLARLRDRST